MSVKLASDCWARWEAVIRHIAANYTFPASTEDGLNVFLHMNPGSASTFRASSGGYKFVIDVTRRGNRIMDIVAITITAKQKQDPRCNGYVITRACDIHPNESEEELPGAPELRWIQVTSGGECYRHCCDKESNALDKAHAKPRLSWETTRLRIIQKAYEQEVLALQRKSKKKSKRSATQDARTDTEVLRQNSEKEIEALRRLLEEVSGELEKEKESRKKWKDAARKKANNIDAIDLTSEDESSRPKLENEIASLKEEKRILKEDKRLLQEDKQRSVKLLQAVQDNSRRSNGEFEKRLRDLRKANDDLQEGHLADKKNLQALQNTNIALRDRIKEMSAELKILENNIQILKANHTHDKEELLAEVEHLKADNSRLQNAKKSVDQYANSLKEKLQTFEKQPNHASQTIKKLEEDLQLKNDHSRRTEEALEGKLREAQAINRKQAIEMIGMRKTIRDKDECITQLQQRTPNDCNNANSQHQQPIMFSQYPSEFALSRDLEVQRNNARRAENRADRLQHELDNMSMRREHDRDNSIRVQELSKRCDEHTAEIANLTSELEAAKWKLMESEENLSDKTLKATLEVQNIKREMQELEKKYAEKVAAMASMERRFHDKDAYTENLETKLEELRGTMENVLGQVSVHQGRKRRRTEGPDFQL
ncbi:hypothetical protein CGLO_07404 [Colletotrichum gloeosporioides Cg-14]|uniref:Uncharacterized protein n=1 Tax=Colletotrichum gloeosporioides (strain Cg-14) TaxID=1237896 RepID=T0KLX4_COLGC|nr:hypothetical protein CGLO_07404 [Colletotrichum gloeosporioides Cg-14]